MEVCHTEVKQEVVQPFRKIDESEFILMDDAAIKRKRRQDRMEIMRRKRNHLPLDDLDLIYKRQRIEPVYSFHQGAVGMDATKIRQLKNRESAERSRLKKDNLIDSLTCQVCECYVQLTDLQLENMWLKGRSESGSSGESSECSSRMSVTSETASVRDDTDAESCCTASPSSSSSGYDSGGERSLLSSVSESEGDEDYSSIIEDFDLLLETSGDYLIYSNIHNGGGTLCF